MKLAVRWRKVLSFAMVTISFGRVVRCAGHGTTDGNMWPWESPACTGPLRQKCLDFNENIYASEMI
jgi:hypothetical protein